MNRNDIDSVLRSLRRVNLQGSFFGQTVAIRFGLSESDVEALELLHRHGRGDGRQAVRPHGPHDRRRHPRHRPARAGRLCPARPRSRPTGGGSSSSSCPRRSPPSRRRSPASARRAPRRSATTARRELAVINDFLTRMEDITHDEATALRDAPRPDGRRLGARRPDRRPQRGPAPVPLRRERAAAPGRHGARRPLPGEVRGPGPPGPPPRRRRVRSSTRAGSSGTGASARSDVALNTGLPWDIEVVGGAEQGPGQARACSMCARSSTPAASTSSA